MKAFHLPINNLSFGQISVNLLKELYKRQEKIVLFGRGNVDISSYNLDENFIEWLRGCFSSSLKTHNRENHVLNLWHINGLMESVSLKNDAFTFHETSVLTEEEKNILHQQRVIFVTSKYTKSVFESEGIKNVVYCPLGLDKDSFFRTEKDYHQKDIITFGLRGKLERRKHTLKVMKAWAAKYGNNEKYRLDCSIQNQHMSLEAQEQMILGAFGGKIPWNINLLPFQLKNDVFNECLNAVDIDLTGMSGCEGFNLPLFQSLCIGKQAVVLNAHVHKDFCNEKNSFLVKSSGVIDAEDGIFFAKGSPFNQGVWFDFNDDEFISAMEQAEKVAKERNVEGEKLSEVYTYENTLNILLNN